MGATLHPAIVAREQSYKPHGRAATVRVTIPTRSGVDNELRRVGTLATPARVRLAIADLIDRRNPSPPIPADEWEELASGHASRLAQLYRLDPDAELSP